MGAICINSFVYLFFYLFIYCFTYLLLFFFTGSYLHSPYFHGKKHRDVHPIHSRGNMWTLANKTFRQISSWWASVTWTTWPPRSPSQQSWAGNDHGKAPLCVFFCYIRENMVKWKCKFYIQNPASRYMVENPFIPMFSTMPGGLPDFAHQQ